VKDLKPVVGITMGDAAGVGPELVIKALSEIRSYEICNPIVIGDIRVLSRAADAVGSSVLINPISSLDNITFRFGKIDVLDLSNVDVGSLLLGAPSAMTGKAAIEYIESGVRLSLRHQLDALMTAPVSKESIRMAGFPYPGHTELLADLTKSTDYALMLISDRIRVVHVTAHLALSEVFGHVTFESILKKTRLTYRTLKDYLGLEAPRIAIAGLNPHAGESGLFGSEESKIIAPAIEEAKRQGIDVSGPYPPDSIFLRAYNGEFDAVVAMYHDQGHIAVKMVGFMSGVNATIGLPIIRTSPDHGTAWDKAGKGTANPLATIKAIEIASLMARNKTRNEGISNE
jgi:4-hydroxythreonine-4-phosphate dehydrogenase